MAWDRPTKIIKVFPKHGALSVCVRVGGMNTWSKPAVWIGLEHGPGGYYEVASAGMLIGRIAQAIEYVQQIQPLVDRDGWAFYDAVTEVPIKALTEFPDTRQNFELEM